MLIAVSRLRGLVERALQHYGYTDDEVPLLADVILYAQLRDNNQGIVKLIPPGFSRGTPVGEVQTVRDTKVSALLDGNQNPGMVVMMRAVDLAIAKANGIGIAIVGTFNTGSSTGAIGYYARRLAYAGFIGFVFAGSPMTVAAHGSFQPLFGTNPLAVGLPSASNPVVFDMATSAISWYGLIEAKVAGRLIPDDVAYDEVGNRTTDPERAMGGAIRPFDRGPKGSGLSMIAEVLTGPLVGAAFADIGDVWGNWGNLVIALDPGLLVSADEFRHGVTELVGRMKEASTLPGVPEILVPGERGDVLSRARLESDEIEIEDTLLAELEKVAAQG